MVVKDDDVVDFWQTRKRSRRRFLYSVGWAAVGIALAQRRTAAEPVVPSERLSFELLGRPAEYGPTLSHQILGDLQVWHNRVYVGHGDWHTNTGPVRAMYFDIDSDTIVHDDEFAFDDEAIESFVVLEDVLYAIGTDALAVEGWNFGNLYRKPWGGVWEKLHTVPWGVHLFGLGELNGVLIASGTEVDPATITSSGQASSQGAIWQSWDNGLTWAVAMRFGDPGFYQGPEGFESSVIALEDRLVVATPKHGCYVFDGSGWSTSDCVPSTPNGVKNAVRFGTVRAMAPRIPAAGTGNVIAKRVVFSDGREHWPVEFGGTIRDIVVDRDTLFILMEISSQRAAIMATDDVSCQCLDAFVRVVTVDPDIRGPRSLEYIGGNFFLGTADGRLFRSSPYRP